MCAMTEVALGADVATEGRVKGVSIGLGLAGKASRRKWILAGVQGLGCGARPSWQKLSEALGTVAMGQSDSQLCWDSAWGSPASVVLCPCD